MTSRRRRRILSVSSRRSERRLDRLVEEAVVDCYNESEQRVGLYTMIEENLAVPFETIVLGVSVIVEGVDLTQSEEIVAVCRRGRARQTVPILDLPLPSPRPAGGNGLPHTATGSVADKIVCAS